MLSPAEFLTVPSEDTARISQSSTLDAPCSMAPTTSSRISPESHSSTVFILVRRPWSLSIDMGRTSSRLLVMKFSIPFLVGTSFCLRARLPVVFCKDP